MGLGTKPERADLLYFRGPLLKDVSQNIRNNGRANRDKNQIRARDPPFVALVMWKLTQD